LIGDVNQLPSVGPGTVLKNLINSDCFYVTKLTKIKRQNAGDLVETIKKMTTEVVRETVFNDDTMSILNIRDFFDKDKVEILRDRILKLIQENNLTQHNSKFITYFRDKKFLFNTVTINNLLQDIYNPNGHIIPSRNKYENGTIFKIHDKIIRTENDYTTEKMRANGEQAKITGFNGKLITIIYDDGFDKEEFININELHENFKLNYCTTIHSAQGSQYDNVIFFIQPGQSYIIDKTSVYTATSRAKKKCIIISKNDDFISCQQNVRNVDGKISLFMRESNLYEL
jgi:exodeoxyribonuclease V alpha subunit